MERDAKKRDPAPVEEAPPDYWTSTMPADELFWYPLVAHLQVHPLLSTRKISKQR